MSPGKKYTAQQSIIQMEHVTFGYRKLVVLNKLSLQVPFGEIFGILGANGAGKTTLIRILAGFLTPGSGNVRVLGETASPKLSQHIGYMPQLNALYLGLSVQENLDFFSRMYGLANSVRRREAVDSVLNLVALWDRRKDLIQHLSGGMRQRVSLAIALVHRPSLLLLDEPTVGLDPELRAAFWEYFRSLTAQGTTLIISSHTMDDAAHCDRLIFLRDGGIIADGSPSELRGVTGRTDATLEDAFLHFVTGGGSHYTQ